MLQLGNTVQYLEIGFYSLGIPRQCFEEDVNPFSVSVDAGRDREEGKYRGFGESTEHGGHCGCQCHQGDERCQDSIHGGRCELAVSPIGHYKQTAEPSGSVCSRHAERRREPARQCASRQLWRRTCASQQLISRPPAQPCDPDPTTSNRHTIYLQKAKILEQVWRASLTLRYHDVDVWNGNRSIFEIGLLSINMNQTKRSLISVIKSIALYLQPRFSWFLYFLYCLFIIADYSNNYFEPKYRSFIVYFLLLAVTG